MTHDDGMYEEQQDMRPVGDTLFCFLDENRVCNASCISFLTVRPEGKDYEEQPWACCSLLVNGHRVGKHVTVLAQLGADLAKHLRIKSADAVREANNPMAKAKGG